MRRWTIANAFLGVLLVAILFGIVGTWTRSLPPVAEVQAKSSGIVPGGERHGERGKRAVAVAEKAAAARAQQTPAIMVAAIAEKDLFDVSRRAPAADEKVDAPKPPVIPPVGVTLVGVSIVGKEREAIVTDAGQGNQQRRLRVGDAIGDGYTVKHIERTEVVLNTRGGDAVSLPLALDKSKGGAPKPPAPPGGPPRRGPQGTAAASPAAGVQPGAPPGGAPTRPGVPSVPPPVPQPPKPGQPGQGGQPAPGAAVGTGPSLGRKLAPGQDPGRRRLGK
jgi:hypothetical protein